MQPADQQSRFADDLRRFLKIICKHTKLSPLDVTSGTSRALGHTKMRHLLIWLMYREGHSTTDIAAAFETGHAMVNRAIKFCTPEIRHRHPKIMRDAHTPIRLIGDPIIDTVAKITGIHADAIISRSNNREVANARHMAIVLFSEANPQADDTACAQFVNRRHLTTAKESRARAAKLCATDDTFRAAMQKARELVA